MGNDDRTVQGAGASPPAEGDPDLTREGTNDAARAALRDEALASSTKSLITDLLARLDALTAELALERRRSAELEKLAVEDPLVSVLNRRGFMQALTRAISYVARHATPAALIFIDIDNFKAVNDSQGHGAGDAALRDYGKLLRNCIRASDTIGRIGGDEFAIILWNASDGDADQKARELAAMIEARTVLHEGREIRVGASAGGTVILGGDTPESVLARADQAMYAAKRARRLRQ
jgi:diguanylate cyclase (GGDEF)-like protein